MATAVVFPAPGGPMKTYQGRSYRYCLEPSERIRAHSEGLSVPKLTLRRSAIASSNRSRSCPTCSAAGSGRADVGASGGTSNPRVSVALARRAFTLFHVQRVTGPRKSTAIWIHRIDSAS